MDLATVIAMNFMRFTFFVNFSGMSMGSRPFEPLWIRHGKAGLKTEVKPKNRPD